ncbi:hypothetical protein ACJJTC_006332 [Scirpophaga incertulas]
MSHKGVIIFCALILGSVALPKPEIEDTSIYFEEVSPNSRIVGGIIADNGAHPYMAALMTGYVGLIFICGGSIITPWSILSAAHCIVPVYSDGALVSSLRISVGSNYWEQGVLYKVIGNATHAEYNSRSIKNDIGLLFTETAIRYSKLIQPIAISYKHIEGEINVMATGWGSRTVNGAIRMLLREIKLQTVGGLRCKEDVERSGIIHNMRPPAVDPWLEVCTTHEEGAGHGTCRGDSGGPLFRMDTREQIGVVSWGLPCALGAPDMFTRLSSYRDWLVDHIK